MWRLSSSSCTWGIQGGVQGGRIEGGVSQGGCGGVGADGRAVDGEGRGQAGPAHACVPRVVDGRLSHNLQTEEGETAPKNQSIRNEAHLLQLALQLCWVRHPLVLPGDCLLETRLADHARPVDLKLPPAQLRRWFAAAVA